MLDELHKIRNTKRKHSFDEGENILSTFKHVCNMKMKAKPTRMRTYKRKQEKHKKKKIKETLKTGHSILNSSLFGPPTAFNKTGNTSVPFVVKVSRLT